MVEKDQVAVEVKSNNKQDETQDGNDSTVEQVKETIRDDAEVEKPDADNIDAVTLLKQEYEKKIADICAKHDKALKERDATIKELIHGSGDITPETKSIIDEINAKREHYKKW